MRSFRLCVLCANALIICSFGASINSSLTLNSSACLPETETQIGALRLLEYSDGSVHPISIPFPFWSSVQILAQISQILLSETMNFTANFLVIDSIKDSVVARYVLGCPAPDDFECTHRKPNEPLVHLTLETWETGKGLIASLPENDRPTFISTQGYAGYDTLFLWQDTITSGLQSPERIVLNHYLSYNADLNKPAKFFDRWETVLDLLPVDVVVPCAQRNPDGDDFDSEQYMTFTNDTQGGCSIDPRVWLSPSCRANTTECLPVLVQYSASMYSQLAFFHRMPFAIIRVDRGQYDYMEYYSVAQRSRCLFSYWSPNDRVVDGLGRAPEQLVVPRANPLEQAIGLYRTGPAATQLVGYAWPGLARAAPQALFLAARLSLQEQEMSRLMQQSYLRKRASLPDDATPAAAAAAAAAVSRQVACEWLRENRARWAAWIPASCQPGTAPAPSLTDCAACAAGRYCAGGYSPPVDCPAGAFCPAGASAPIPCPDGRGTLSSGAQSARACTVCPAGAWATPTGGACVLAATVLSATLLSIAAALGALGVALLLSRRAADRADWGVAAGDLEYCRPEVVLGRGPRAVTVKAFRRGTPVAVKCYLLKARAGSGKGAAAFGGSDRTMGQASSSRALAGVGMESANATGGPAGIRAGEVYALREAPSRGASECHSSGVMSSSAGVGLGRGGSGRVGPSQQEVLAGVRLQGGLRHPSIVAVMGAIKGPHGLRVVMELMELGSLTDLLPNRSFRFGAGFAGRTLRGVSRGLRFLHEARPPVPHGALHTGNILIDRHLCARIADLALLRTPPLPLEADVYAFGVVAHEVLARSPFADAEVCRDPDGDGAGEGRAAPPAGCSVDMAALIGDCLCPRPADRPTFGEVDRRLRAIPTRRVCSHAVPAANGDADDEDGEEGLSAASMGQLQGIIRSASGGTSSSNTRKARGSRVIASLFPAHVAEALVRGEKPEPEAKAMVTVFFSDIVGYTDLSAGLASGQVGDLLNRLFDRFDDAAEACGVSKVDTIGDAYLCATNLAGDQAADHAARMARFAAAALRAADDTLVDPADPARRVRIRVGLHSGPCTAAVVGRQCPKYTLFGDTVNVAARMEQSGEAGRAQCTSFTAGLIRAQDPGMRLTRRGTVEVKGKGAMETYWLAEGHDPFVAGDETQAIGHADDHSEQNLAAVADPSALIWPGHTDLGLLTTAAQLASPRAPSAMEARGHADRDYGDAKAWINRVGNLFGSSSRRVGPCPADQPDGPGADPV